MNNKITKSKEGKKNLIPTIQKMRTIVNNEKKEIVLQDTSAKIL